MFGDRVAESLSRILGRELVGVYFVGSVALGGFVPHESDIDVVAVCCRALTRAQARHIASAVVEVSAACPARGLQLTLYRLEVVAADPVGGDFEVMRTAARGCRRPCTWTRRWSPASGTSWTVSSESMAWHRAHEGATLYSVLNACRAWRSAE